MIELAPRHKIGLPVDSPILLAGGSVGYGEAIHPSIDTTRLGGIVVGPITRRSIRGSDGPRLAETNGGFVLQTGLQNRGVSAVVKNFARHWPRLGCPVIAQIADNTAEEAASTAKRLAQVDGVMGLELRLSPSMPSDELRPQLRSFLRSLRRVADLPVWVKLPLASDESSALAGVETLAEAAARAGADGLVIGSPPLAAAFHRQGALVRGELYGPGVFALMLASLSLTAGLGLDLPLIACGGIHTGQQVKQALAAGASAVQIDSLVWVEPDALAKIVEMGA